MCTGDELYLRGAATLVASWSEDSRGSEGAALRRLPGVSAVVFPNGPERTYFNAVFERGLANHGRTEAITAMENAYAAASVTRFRGWVHATDRLLRRDLERRSTASTPPPARWA